MTITSPAITVPLTAAAGDPVPPTGFYAKHGLLRTGSPGLQTRWEMDGVHFQSRLCASYHATEIERCLDLETVGGTPETCPGVVDFKPYRIEMSVENGPLRVDSATWLADRLMLGLSQMVEATIWAGGPGLGNPLGNVGLDAGTAVTVAAAAGPLGLLGAAEDKILSAMAGAGTIHVPAHIAVQITDALVDDGDILRTKATGSKVVIGNYPDANTIAAHIGNIDVYLGQSITQDDYFDRTVNSYFTRAWVDATAAWNTCAAWTITYTP
jgi:hypothetical protein